MEVATLTTLDLSAKNISTIDDIIYFTSLTDLNLSYNSIYDLTPLKTFINFSDLVTLNLSFNQIYDLSPFTGLTNASGIINLGSNDDITDWSPVPKENITNVLGRPDYAELDTVVPLLDGTTYKISLPAHLAWLAAQGEEENFAGKTILFMNDIDMNNQSFSGIPKFSGIMDGNNKTITKLKIVRSADHYVGLVRSLKGGTIKNLTIGSGSIS